MTTYLFLQIKQFAKHLLNVLKGRYPEIRHSDILQAIAQTLGA